jgi:hypothetical protein
VSLQKLARTSAESKADAVAMEHADGSGAVIVGDHASTRIAGILSGATLAEIGDVRSAASWNYGRAARRA